MKCEKVEGHEYVYIDIYPSTFSSYVVHVDEVRSTLQGHVFLSSKGYDSTTFKGYVWHYFSQDVLFTLYIPGMRDLKNGIWEASGMVGVKNNVELVRGVPMGCKVVISNK